MRLSIGSFNVLNFKTDAKSNRDDEFKHEKVKRIASIINRRGLDIVCLQEVQSCDTVRQIVYSLNGGGNTYDFVHCGSIYEELAEDYPFKSGIKSELAFIWNADRVSMDKDMVVYKGIHDKFLRAIDGFLESATVVIAGLVANAIDVSDKNDKDPEDTDNKVVGRNRVLSAMGGAGVVTGLGYLGHLKMRDEIEGVLRNTIRPPLVGLFRIADGGTGENTQIRVVNVHSQFGKTKYDKIGGVKLRKIEAAFVLGDIFEIVDSERNGKNDTAHTIIAGDFNLVTKDIADVVAVVNEKIRDKEKYRQVAQKELTTIALANGEAVKIGEEPPRYELKHDYDHFIFRSSCWSADSAMPVRDDDLFFIGRQGDQDYRPISDHYPIVITTDKV